MENICNKMRRRREFKNEKGNNKIVEEEENKNEKGEG